MQTMARRAPRAEQGQDSGSGPEAVQRRADGALRGGEGDTQALAERLQRGAAVQRVAAYQGAADRGVAQRNGDDQQSNKSSGLSYGLTALSTYFGLTRGMMEHAASNTAKGAGYGTTAAGTMIESIGDFSSGKDIFKLLVGSKIPRISYLAPALFGAGLLGKKVYDNFDPKFFEGYNPKDYDEFGYTGFDDYGNGSKGKI